MQTPPPEATAAGGCRDGTDRSRTQGEGPCRRRAAADAGRSTRGLSPLGLRRGAAAQHRGNSF